MDGKLVVSQYSTAVKGQRMLACQAKARIKVLKLWKISLLFSLLDAVSVIACHHSMSTKLSNEPFDTPLGLIMMGDQSSQLQFRTHPRITH